MKWLARLLCSWGFHKWHEGAYIRYCTRDECDAEEKLYPGEHF